MSKEKGMIRKLAFAGLFLGGIVFTTATYAQDLNSAIKLTMSEQYESAAQVYQSLIAKEPGNGDNYYFYGENFLKSYLTDSASADFTELTKTAIELFNKGAKADSLNPLNFIGLGKIFISFKKLDNAIFYFNLAESLLPSRQNRKSTIPPEKQALTYNKIAEAFILSSYQDTTLIFSKLRKAIKADPRNPETYILIGDAYLLKLNDGTNAIANYKKAQSLDTKSPKSNLRIGQLWMRAKNYNDALAYYREAIKIDSTFAPAYRELAELYAMARRYGEAIKTYNKFLSLSTTNITAKVRFASFLFMAKEYQQSIDKINEIRKEDTTFVILNRLLAYSYCELNQADKGLPYINKFFKLAKPDKILPSDWTYWGKLLQKTKNDSLAVEKFLVGYNMDTSNSDALRDLAISYNRLKKYNDAASCYMKPISSGKANPNDYYNLGKVYYQAKQWGKADTVFAEYIRLQPTYLQAYLWRARVNTMIDSNATQGLAKPYFDKVIELGMADSAKYVKEVAEAYSFLGYYYFKQYNLNKKQDEACLSIKYCEKVMAMVPPTDDKYKKAKSTIDFLAGKCKG
jgi:tetratricopeptide (TPR) repeat protein